MDHRNQLPGQLNAVPIQTSSTAMHVGQNELSRENRGSRRPEVETQAISLPVQAAPATYHPFHLLGQPMAIPIQMSSAAMHMGQNDSFTSARNGMQNGGISQAESIISISKKLEDDLHARVLKIREYEENIKILNSQKNSLDDSILDLQVSLGNHHSSMPRAEDGTHVESEGDTIQQINGNSAAGMLSSLNTLHESQASHLNWSKDVLGVVATLGKVDDDNLSRLLSEYLGITKMLAVVSKTYEGIESLEKHGTLSSVVASFGLHEFGSTIERNLNQRVIGICLEGLRPYYGGFITNDPQRRLDLLVPKLPNGGPPPGFIGFAVNMINIDSRNLYCLSGQGLRETLFYNLFSRLQVYRTRADMLQARPCISDGAISLDGGIITCKGTYLLGNRQAVDVKFLKNCGPSSQDHSVIKKRIEEMTCHIERLMEDIRRSQGLLNHAKLNFEMKRQEFLTFIHQSSAYATQVNHQA